MRHRTQSGSAEQIPLALIPMAGLDSNSVLRSAYTRLELSRRLSFEQVMSNRAYAIGVRNLADAMARRERAQARRRIDTAASAIALNVNLDRPPIADRRFRLQQRKPLMLRRLYLAWRLHRGLRYSWHLAWYKAAQVQVL